MAVIPSMAVLSRLEVVRVSIVCSNGTLRDTVDPISLVGMELTNAMPVDGSPIIGQIIGDVNGLDRLRVSILSNNPNNLGDFGSEQRSSGICYAAISILETG